MVSNKLAQRLADDPEWARDHFAYIEHTKRIARRLHLGCYYGYPCKYGDGISECTNDPLADALEDAFDAPK